MPSGDCFWFWKFNFHLIFSLCTFDNNRVFTCLEKNLTMHNQYTKKLFQQKIKSVKGICNLKTVYRKNSNICVE